MRDGRRREDGAEIRIGRWDRRLGVDAPMAEGPWGDLDERCHGGGDGEDRRRERGPRREARQAWGRQDRGGLRELRRTGGYQGS